MILSFNSVSNIMDNPFDLEQKNKIKEKQNHRFDFFFFFHAIKQRYFNPALTTMLIMLQSVLIKIQAFNC